MPISGVKLIVFQGGEPYEVEAGGYLLGSDGQPSGVVWASYVPSMETRNVVCKDGDVVDCAPYPCRVIIDSKQPSGTRLMWKSP